MDNLRHDFSRGEPAPIVIGTTRITSDSNPYVIAEAGVNHDGEIAQARRLIEAARDAGASAVKFQIFSAEELVSASAPSASYQTTAGCSDSQRALLKRLELPFAAFEELAEHCRRVEIDFLATPFTIGAVGQVVELRAPAIKIASTDLNNLPLLEAAVRTGLPLLLSTGASRLDEIDETICYLDQQKARARLVLMHCVSSYPTADLDASLSSITMLRRRYGIWAGYSDHTESIEAAGLAVACGAKVLEKHLTLDRGLSGPDHAFSLTPKMFGQYVQSACAAWRMMGRPRDGVFAVEQEVRRLARRSVVARAAIRRGQTLTADLLTTKRPAGGIPPSDMDKLMGKIACCDIPAEVPIEWGMVR